MNSGRLTKEEGESKRNQADEKNKGQERLIHTSGEIVNLSWYSLETVITDSSPQYFVRVMLCYKRKIRI